MEILHIEVLKYKNGKYAALDMQSGGYPYETNSIFRAHKWESKSMGELNRYLKSFPDLTLQRLLITIEDE